MGFRVALLAIASALAACSGGGGATTMLMPQPNPSPLAIQHAYVGQIRPAELLAYNLPLIASEQPSASLPLTASAYVNDCVDPTGALYVAAGGSIYAFATPITSTSSPVFVLPTDNVTDCAVDAQGNLYVRTNIVDNVALDIYPEPVHAGEFAVPIADLTQSYFLHATVTTDSASDVFTADANSGLIQEWSPRNAGNKVIATFGGTMRGSYGMSFGPDGNLYVANTFSNGIDVYKPTSFHDGGVKDHTVSLQQQQPHYIAFDRAGNMLVTVSQGSTSALLVVPPPYTAVSLIVPTPNSVFGTSGIAVSR